MICPFCNNNMYENGMFYTCRHENELIIKDNEIPGFIVPETISICKNGYKIESCENCTELFHYQPTTPTVTTVDNEFYFNGYNYGWRSNMLIKFDSKIDITPHNFDYTLNKLLKLIPFS